MIPLIVLALGLGAALTIYELSPRARSRIDPYVRAIQAAHASHREADGHLGNATAAAMAADRHARQAQSRYVPPPLARPEPPPSAPLPFEPSMPAPSAVQTPVTMPSELPPMTYETQPSPVSAPVIPEPEPEPEPAPDVAFADPQARAAQVAADAAVDHAIAATEANQAAAASTADAAQSAQTAVERQAAAESAARVVDREKKIAAAFARLGVGQCGVRSFPRVTEQIRDALIARLHSEGMVVTGNNPWNINTHQYDVKLRAAWDPGAQVLKLIVTSGKGGYFGLVTCDQIWKRIDPIMRDVVG